MSTSVRSAFLPTSIEHVVLHPQRPGAVDHAHLQRLAGRQPRRVAVVAAAVVVHRLLHVAEHVARAVRLTRLARLIGWDAPLDTAVASAFDAAVAQLAAAGVEWVTIEAPEAAERATIFPIVLAVELSAASAQTVSHDAETAWTL